MTNENKAPELLPCPFCGGEAALIEDSSHSTACSDLSDAKDKRIAGLVSVSAKLKGERDRWFYRDLSGQQRIAELEAAMEETHRATKELRARAEAAEAALEYANKRIEHAFERNDRQAQTIDGLTTKLARAMEMLKKEQTNDQ